MFYDFAVVVPKGTLENAPVVETIKLTQGLIIRIDVEFPAGCRGYISAVVMVGGHQLYPTNPAGSMNAEDFTVQAWDFYPLFEAPYTLKVKAWSPEADYGHTLTVRVDLVRIEELTKLLPIFQGLEKLLEYMGVPAAEEEVIPETPPPPVCTIGETKCEGNDLYECQEVEGAAAWVLKEADSRQCLPVQPPEPEQPQPPPPPPPEPLPVPSEGEILEITWVEIDGPEHPLSDPIPHLAGYRQRFKIKNVGEVTADFRVAYYTTGFVYIEERKWAKEAEPVAHYTTTFGEGYHYSGKVNLVPEQIAYINMVFWAGAKPGSYTVTWHLFSYDKDVYQKEATHIIGAEEQK